jgi:uncharacterized protein YdaU (DUF1376 family)
MESILWFKMYPAETLSDELFSGWSIEERGAWLTLILVNWREGSIPSDQTTLARLLHVDSGTMRSLWSAIGSRFVRHPDVPERLTSPRVEREREAAQRLMDQKVEAGRKGANSRWSKEKLRNGSRIGLPCAANATAMANDSDKERRGEERRGQPSHGGPADELDEFRLRLGTALGYSGPLAFGKDRVLVERVFREQLALAGPEALLLECRDLAAKSTTGTPGTLSWFVGWLNRLPAPSEANA